MNSYDIIVTPDAEEDLISLRDYIGKTLCAPDTARSYIRTIYNSIQTLSEMPARIQPLEAEPWHSRGVRRLFSKNHYIYYRIAEKDKKVFILAIIYSKRDQLRQLNSIKDTYK